MFTKEELIYLGVEKLADIILSLSQDNPDNEKKIVLAGFDSDPKRIILTIEKEISSLEDFCSSLEHYEGDILADQIEQVRTHIIENLLPKYPNQAAELLLSLLDSYESCIGAVDDEDGTVGEVFRQALDDLVTAYESVIHSSVEDIVQLVYNLHMNSSYDDLMCFDDDDIIIKFKNVLRDEGLKQLKQKLEQSLNQKNDTAIRRGLESIAKCQNNIDIYIQACTLAGRPNAGDHLNIAKRLIEHTRYEEAIHWIDSANLDETSYLRENKMALKIQALDLYGKHGEAQTERQEWFNIRLSPKVYNEILKNAKEDTVEALKNTAFQRAFEFKDPHVALKFFREIKEFEQAAKLVNQKIDTLDTRVALDFFREMKDFEQAAKLVHQKIDSLDPHVALEFLIQIQDFEQAAKLVHQKIDALKGTNFYNLPPIADRLCETDPLAATLIYRKMIEPCLASVHTKYKKYYYPVKNLIACHSLSSKITDWKGYKNHHLYFEELSVQHKDKKRFWSEYTLAFKTKTGLEVMLPGSKKRKIR